MLLITAALSACGGGGGTSSAGTGSSGVSGSSSSSSSSGAGGTSSGARVFSTSSPNVVAVAVGPGTSSFFNIPTTTVTVCMAGTNTCVAVANVLVDTGSVGLRLMASTLTGVTLTRQSDPNTPSNVIAECLPFADGYTWGPVAVADVSMGGEKALNVPVNVIDDANSFSPAVPADCTNNGTSLNSVTALGANGVLGVGLFAQDCGSYCARPVNQQSSPFFYYSCSPSTCTPASEPVNSQVVNPVALFPSDNNGVIVQLPAIPDSGQRTASGFLVFGIGTQSNNGLGTATVLTVSGNGTFTSVYNGNNLNGSFLDSGSNGLFFPDPSIRDCPGSAQDKQFYCPPTTLDLTASNQGQNGATSQVSFTIANLQQLGNTHFALDDVGGAATSIMSIGTSYFDFGLPFFYGRTVFTAIENMPADGTTGPYFAY